MNKFSLIAFMAATLLSCGDPAPKSDAPKGDFTEQSPNGFEAIVEGSYTATDMQAHYGDYCKRQGKIMRSLQMKPQKNGTQLIIGDCI